MEPQGDTLEDKLRNYIIAETNESKAFQQDRIKNVKGYIIIT
ncbi:hypothetical protein LCGC14_2126380, partial [marine sediment metagenome]